MVADEALVGDVEQNHLLLRGSTQPALALGVGQVGQSDELASGDAPVAQRESEVVLTVLLTSDTGVIAVHVRRRLGHRAVGELVAEVLLLEHLTEQLRPPLAP